MEPGKRSNSRFDKLVAISPEQSLLYRQDASHRTGTVSSRYFSTACTRSRVRTGFARKSCIPQSTARAIVVRAIGGDGDNRRLPIAGQLTNLFGRFKAVPTGHLQIHQDHIKLELWKPLSARLPSPAHSTSNDCRRKAWLAMVWATELSSTTSTRPRVFLTSVRPTPASRGNLKRQVDGE